MTKRKRMSASNATAYVVLTIGAVAAINLIATRVFGRLDLTENKVYTLSPASKDIVRALPDYFTVKAYISKDLPPELATVSRYVRDLLDEYRASSKGKLRFESFDPGSDKKIEDEAGQCKVQRLQVQVMRQQKFEVGAYFLGLCFQYQGKDEAIPEIGQAEGLEYQISSLIKRMTQKKRKVAFTTGHGEQDLNQGFTFLKHVLEQEFDTATVNPSTAPIGDDVDALVVGGPKQAFDDKGRHEIDAFLMKGRGAIFLYRRHGAVRAARRDARHAVAAEDRPGQRGGARRAARQVRLQDRPGLRLRRQAERPRPHRRGRPEDAGELAGASSASRRRRTRICRCSRGSTRSCSRSRAPSS